MSPDIHSSAPRWRERMIKGFLCLENESNYPTMSDERTLVFFDLEATGLDTTANEIIQLSAVSEEKVFNVYILPHRPLTESAMRVTGFRVRDNALLLHGQPVVTTPLHQALSSFIDFLRSFRRPVLLVAHGAKRFDAPVLSRVLRQYSLKHEFQQVVSGFLDTFCLSKKLFPYQLSSFSQESMVKHFLGKSYNAHNAVEDARMLQELYKRWNPRRRDLIGCTFTLPAY
ncbi:hypothetical protein LDENG_00085010 [Lucifuga dentata]|nr:hypothetical protein LDENG_00085010 [Lucifuga dentata]